MPQYVSWSLKRLHHSATLLSLALAVTLMSVGCMPRENPSATQPDTAASSGTSAKPTVEGSSNSGAELATLNMAVIPAQITANQEKLQPLADYLTKTLGRPVKFQVTKDYDTAVNLLVEGKVELAYLGALTYIKARQRDPQIEPLVAPIEKTTGRPWYNSIIVINSDSGIKTLEDLKGKRFAFVSKSSTSGYLVPLAHFKDIGIDPDRDFVTVNFAGDHQKAKEQLISGKVDAIADDKPSYLAQEKAGKIDTSKYKIIWESSPIPNLPIVASSKLSAQVKADLKKAFINAPEGLIDITNAEGIGYTLIQDSDYESMRKLQKSLGLK